MLRLLAQNWWLFVVQGIIAVFFGLSALFIPGRTLQMFVILFGTYALVDGLLSLVRGIRAATHGLTWWPFLLQGLAGIVAYLVTFNWPGLTALLLAHLIAGWATWTGLFQLFVGIRYREELERESLLILSGPFSILFGIWLFAVPADGALAVVWLVGACAVVVGALVFMTGLRLSAVGQRMEPLWASRPA